MLSDGAAGVKPATRKSAPWSCSIRSVFLTRQTSIPRSSAVRCKRIAIARALASNPKVLLCDEATSALDPNTTHSILSLIQDINKRLGITAQ